MQSLTLLMQVTTIAISLSVSPDNEALIRPTQNSCSANAERSCTGKDQGYAPAADSALEANPAGAVFSVPLDEWPDHFEYQSEHQHILFSGPTDGSDNCLVLDGTVQICESYRPHYHEIFTHFPAAYLDKLEHVLIIGGGDAMILNEVLKYPSVTKVVQLELDPDVTRVCADQFGVDPHYDDPRVEWIFGDAAQTIHLLKNRDLAFDLVIIDISETVTSGSVDGTPFFDAVAALMHPKGIMIKNEDYQAHLTALFDQFLEVLYELPVIVTQTFCIGSNGTSLLAPNFKLFQEAGIKTKFYKPLSDRAQHGRLIRHYNQKQHIEDRLFGVPERNMFEQANRAEAMNLPIELPVGRHLLAEFKGVRNVDALKHESVLSPAVSKSLEAGNVSVVDLTSHQFRPTGVTMLALLEESHFSIHTWPQHRYAAVDIFTCGKTANGTAILDTLAKEIRAGQYAIRSFQRGLYDA